MNFFQWQETEREEKDWTQITKELVLKEALSLQIPIDYKKINEILELYTQTWKLRWHEPISRKPQILKLT